MESTLAMLRVTGILWFAFGLMVSLWLSQLSETVADRYAHAASDIIQARLTNAPQALAGGRADCSRVPLDAAAWDEDLPGSGASQLAWEAAVDADAAIARRVQDRPRFLPAIDADVNGRAGFVSVAAGPAGEDCEVYVRVQITPLGSRFALLRAQSIVCTRYSDIEQPRPCAPEALAT